MINRVYVNVNDRTSLRGLFTLTSLNPDVIENNLRASLRLRQDLTKPRPQVVCTTRQRIDSLRRSSNESPTGRDCVLRDDLGNYALNLEYSYRDRLFNGSLGFQTVQQSIGILLTSPVIILGKSEINLSFQAGVQRVNADTDQLNLVPPGSDNNRATLERYQTSAALTRGFTLWSGKPLPATPKEGLRYSPVAIVPYIGLYTGLTGVASYYSSGDTQNSLNATVGMTAQFGHFSRRFFDYTGLNVSFTQVIFDGLSPFFFDRIADDRKLAWGFSQQLYGPIRIGMQTSINLITNQEINTDYILEYSRRTYSFIVRYNPVQQIGSVNFLLNDFNWSGGTDPFSASEIRTVEGGVIRSND
ncbi:DUF3769 domain-containing protein [Neosynechococcus sphagnicola]|uniref:DUF3769 domain-containing protein n=1 Tax=Neosynechococcus sphagnicola TaxID=1501145 RepID=UPI00068CA93D|nr:DUF3769 domain-containing protein [Neosynechococcus sphagnicola]